MLFDMSGGKLFQVSAVNCQMRRIVFMPAAPSLFSEAFTVSELTAELRKVVEGTFPSVWVAGELSNFTHASSGHWYFTLKDSKAQLRAVMFRGFNLRMKFDPRDGLEVLVRGRLTVYEPRGDCQLIVEEIQPKGIGAAELAFAAVEGGKKLLRQSVILTHSENAACYASRNELGSLPVTAGLLSEISSNSSPAPLAARGIDRPSQSCSG